MNFKDPKVIAAFAVGIIAVILLIVMLLLYFLHPAFEKARTPDITFVWRFFASIDFVGAYVGAIQKICKQYGENAGLESLDAKVLLDENKPECELRVILSMSTKVNASEAKKYIQERFPESLKRKLILDF